MVKSVLSKIAVSVVCVVFTISTSHVALAAKRYTTFAQNMDVTGLVAGGELGYALSNVGDVNGDGIDDMAMGAPADGYGKVYIFFGSTTLSATSYDTSNADVVIEGAASEINFGLSISGNGDLNGDGVDDMVIGHSEASYSGILSAYVFYGPFTAGTYSTDDAAVVLETTTPVAVPTSYVSIVRDVTGDGLDDVLVSIPYDVTGNMPVGQVFAFSFPTTSTTIKTTTTGGVMLSVDILKDYTAEVTGGHCAIGKYDKMSLVGEHTFVSDVTHDGNNDLVLSASGISHSYVIPGPLLGRYDAVDILCSKVSNYNPDMIGEYEIQSGTAYNMGDVNGDGYGDIAFSYKSDLYIFTSAITNKNTMLSNADMVITGVGPVFDIEQVGDQSGDGLPDVYVAIDAKFIQTSYLLTSFKPGIQALSSSIRKVDLLATPMPFINTTVGDWNGDGKIDMLFGDWTDGSMYTTPGNGFVSLYTAI